MTEVRQTEEFSGWLRRLKGCQRSIGGMETGNPGDSKSMGHGILEMRTDYGRVIGSTMCIAERIL